VEKASGFTFAAILANLQDKTATMVALGTELTDDASAFESGDFDVHEDTEARIIEHGQDRQGYSMAASSSTWSTVSVSRPVAVSGQVQQALIRCIVCDDPRGRPILTRCRKCHILACERSCVPFDERGVSCHKCYYPPLGWWRRVDLAEVTMVAALSARLFYAAWPFIFRAFERDTCLEVMEQCFRIHHRTLMKETLWVWRLAARPQAADLIASDSDGDGDDSEPGGGDGDRDPDQHHDTIVALGTEMTGSRERANADVVWFLPPNAFVGQIVAGDDILMCDICQKLTFARLASRCGTCDRIACTGWCESIGDEACCLACDEWASGCHTSVALLDQFASSASTSSSFERLIASEASIGRCQTLSDAWKALKDEVPENVAEAGCSVHLEGRTRGSGCGSRSEGNWKECHYDAMRPPASGAHA
jgi:hypothetical protein